MKLTIIYIYIKMYSRQLNIELPILKVVSPQGHCWKNGYFLSSRTFMLWTMVL